MIQKIKKKLTSFLTEEEGKISKQSLLSLGSFLSAAVIGGILATKDAAAATHSNSISVSYSGDLGSGSHAHHSSHANHANHSSGTTSTTSGTTGGGDGSTTSGTTSTTSTTSGGCGCPFVAVWNGSKYVIENNLLPLSEKIGNYKKDVLDLYLLQTIPAKTKEGYELLITEFEQEKTLITDVELVRVIHDKDIKLTTDKNGEVATYSSLIFPSKATVNKNIDFTKELSSLESDNFFEGLKGDSMKLTFKKVKNLKNARLIFNASLRNFQKTVIPPKIKSFSSLGNFVKEAVSYSSALALGAASAFGNACGGTTAAKSIHINIYANNNDNQEIFIEHPREEFCVSSPVAFSEHISESQQDLVLRLDWTDSHRLSYFGLDTSDHKSDLKSLQITKLIPTKLAHSKKGVCSYDQLKKNNVELLPGEFVKLNFPAEDLEIKENQTVSFLIKLRGHYTSLLSV